MSVKRYKPGEHIAVGDWVNCAAPFVSPHLFAGRAARVVKVTPHEVLVEVPRMDGRAATRTLRKSVDVAFVCDTEAEAAHVQAAAAEFLRRAKSAEAELRRALAVQREATINHLLDVSDGDCV